MHLLSMLKHMLVHFGEYVVNYLVVTYDGNKFHYFYVAYDDEGWELD